MTLSQAERTVVREAGDGLRIERDDRGVLTLVLDNPDNLNALTTPISDRMRAAIESAGPETRCIVLTGAGRAFCSGQDLRSDDRFLGVDVVLGQHYNPLITAITAARVPVVAAVNGVAAGIGAALALACDIRVAADTASIAFLFSKVGLVPDGGATYFLPRITSPAVAAELMLLGGRLDAAEAKERGLFGQVWPEVRFRDELDALVTRLVDGPVAALGLIKAQLHASMSNSLAEQLACELEAQTSATQGAEYAEGRAAFLEKRTPNFRVLGSGNEPASSS